MIPGGGDDLIESLAAQLQAKDARIAELEAANDRLVKMFAEDVYIEHAEMDPGYYDISLRGKGAMLVIGQIIEIFRTSGGKNFLTNTLQMTLPDGKTHEMFELTIQKVDGADSPAMKLQRQAAYIEKLEIALRIAIADEISCRIYRKGLNHCSKEEREAALSDAENHVDEYLEEARSALEELKKKS